MFIYKCPHEKECKIKRHCHIITTKYKLPMPLDVILKCPAEKNDIALKILPESFKKS